MRTAVTVSALALAALVIGPTAVHASPAAYAASAPGAEATAKAASVTKTRATAATAKTRAAAGRAATARTASAAKGDPTPTPTPVPTPSPSSTSTSATDPLLQDVSVDTVSYGPHLRQRMDIWHHGDGVGHPGVFLIHGGWWSSGDKKYMTAISRSYVEQGYTVFNINYRLSTDAAWPAQRTDTLDAIATARRHALLWGFDPANYVVVGFSAGGHLATAAGTYKNGGLPGLRGVVGISPVVSPLTAYNEGADTVDANQRKLRESAIRLAGGCEPDKCPRIWNSMEVPLHASSGDVPVLSVHSQDEFVPAEHSIRLRDRLARFGVSMTVLTEPGVEHSSPLYRLPGVAETVHAWISAKLL